jgi:hypothetical protein
MEERAGRFHQGVNEAQQQHLDGAQKVAVTLGQELHAVAEHARQLQQLLQHEWKAVAAGTSDTLRGLHQEAAKTNEEVRKGLQAACTALRVLAEKLEGTRPHLEQINQTVARVESAAKQGGNGGTKSGGFFSKLFGKG